MLDHAPQPPQHVLALRPQYPVVLWCGLLWWCVAVTICLLLYYILFVEQKGKMRSLFILISQGMPIITGALHDGGIEHKDEVFSSSQLTDSTPVAAKEEQPTPAVVEKVRPSEEAKPLVRIVPPTFPQTATATVFAPAPVAETPKPQIVTSKILFRPQAATSKIFAPRTEDMNKGYLMFSDDETGLTIMKDEPEDLTHLAPTAGDVCIPLETAAFMDDVFDDIMFSDSYCPLLPEDLPTLNSSRNDNSKTSDGDPFLSYRDDSSSEPSVGDYSSRLHSPSHSKSPGESSIPSLCSPADSGDDTDMTHFISLGIESSSDEELSMRAPYIPMEFGDDFPLLVSSDLMWGALPEDTCNEKPDLIASYVPKSNASSSLAKLLQSSTSPTPVKSPSSKSPKYNDHGGGIIDPAEISKQVYTKKGVNQHGGRGSAVATKKNLPTTGPPEKSNKRASVAAQYTSSGKKAKLSAPQLLQHLRDGSSWVLDGGGTIKNVKPPVDHQPSNSVLMNLLVSGCDLEPNPIMPIDPGGGQTVVTMSDSERKEKMRKNSFSLLEPEGSMIPSLVDLSQQDYDVNAPLSSSGNLLQGQELLMALDISSTTIV